MEIFRRNVMTIPLNELRSIAEDYRSIGSIGMAETMHGLLDEIERLRAEMAAREAIASSIIAAGVDDIAGAALDERDEEIERLRSILTRLCEIPIHDREGIAQAWAEARAMLAE